MPAGAGTVVQEILRFSLEFITTSDYTKGAMEYVESLNGSPTIILINGQQLTEYIYDYGLGLQTEKVLKVMKMDMDYWDAMDNA